MVGLWLDSECGCIDGVVNLGGVSEVGSPLGSLCKAMSFRYSLDLWPKMLPWQCQNVELGVLCHDDIQVVVHGAPNVVHLSEQVSDGTKM